MDEKSSLHTRMYAWRTSSKFATVVYSIILLALIVACYSPCLTGDYVWDDHDGLMLGNPQMSESWGWLENWYRPRTLNYEPLTFDTYWVQLRLFGENRLVFHLTNVALHLLNTLLLVRLLKRFEWPGATIAGLLFAVHPVCVESVGWIYERNNLLSTCFALLSALAFQAAIKQRWFYGVGVACFALSLFSKVLAIMFPVVLLACVLWSTERNKVHAWAAVGTCFLMAAVIGSLRINSEQVALHNNTSAHFASTTQHLLHIASLPTFYAGTVLYPGDLRIVYPKTSLNLASAMTFLRVIPTLAMVLAIGWSWRTSWKYVAWGLLFFLVNLVPFSGIFNNAYFRYSYVTDRWQYLAMMGLLAVVAFVLHQLTAQRVVVRRVATVLAVTVLSLLTWRQAHIYQGMERWCQCALAQDPNAYYAHSNLANLLLRRGSHQEAVGHMREAFRIRPQDPEIALNLGAAYLEENKRQAAFEVYEEALRHSPQSEKLNYNFGCACLEMRDIERAHGAFLAAITAAPDFAPAHDKIGSIAVLKRQYESAVEHCRKAVKLAPDNARFRYNLGVAYGMAKKWNEAIEELSQCAKEDGLRQDAQIALTKVYLSTAQAEKAGECLAEVLSTSPEHEEALRLMHHVRVAKNKAALQRR